MNPCDLVRSSAEHVVRHAELVTINDAAIERVVASLDDVAEIAAGSFDRELHYWDSEQPDAVAQYLLVVDALNFCFWPDESEDLQYEHLAGGLRRSLLADPSALDASRLAVIDGPMLRSLLRWPRPLPLEEERARLLREVGEVLLQLYGGLAANLVRAAQGSGVELVRLVLAAFPGFRDCCVYGGRQLHFYKRAQIFVGDLWGCFQGSGLGRLSGIPQLTMFADYRVPVVLRELGILSYSQPLAAAVDDRQQLPAGGFEEVEIRASTIVAVERLRAALLARVEAEGRGVEVSQLCSVKIDWWLWEQGERSMHQHRPHHRTLTIYY
ncbi:hypothetical protein D9Q98_001741 [Chlorella vulgaris]|uniref:Queuosine 5'-phosphate N-glycosylase/hydrolase n=1 Tax=Chlorella vulgaris TaxID=3077 RepID=A0A9D4TV52_CHLVU|nr:hypothetical protein D9Q98_001741 [Chlorella vulgaris]